MFKQTCSISVFANLAVATMIRKLLKEVPGSDFVSVIHEHGDIAQVMGLEPDILLIHHNPPAMDAVRIIDEIRRHSDQARFLVLLSEEQQFWSVIKSRANGYVVFPTTWLPDAINSIVHGGVWLGPVITDFLLRGPGFSVLESAASNFASPPLELNMLSSRERQVLRLLVDGLKNNEIAQELGLSVGTVKVHVKHLLDKLQLSGRGQAIVKLAGLKAVI